MIKDAIKVTLSNLSRLKLHDSHIGYDSIGMAPIEELVRVKVLGDEGSSTFSNVIADICSNSPNLKYA